MSAAAYQFSIPQLQGEASYCMAESGLFSIVEKKESFFKMTYLFSIVQST